MGGLIFFFNVKGAQHFSKASPINHTELSEAKVSNRDESNSKSSPVRPAQQWNDNRQTKKWKQGHPTTIFGKFLFGRRFEI